MRYTGLIISFLFIAAQLSAQDTIKIATWNVFLRPAILADGQMDRVDHISSAILIMDADIICLQELFHVKSRAKLIDDLKFTYPHYVSPGRSGLKQCSGLMLFSKYPVLFDTICYFKHKSGIDAIARKGIQLAKIKLEHEEIVVVNTHLQAGNKFKKQQVRNQQYQKFAECCDDFRERNYWMAGDFNTCDDSTEFELLKNAVRGKEGHLSDSKEKHTSNFRDNDLCPTDSGEAKRIDFIFSKNGSDWDRITQMIYRPIADWRPKGGSFLSDHAWVESVFVRSKIK